MKSGKYLGLAFYREQIQENKFLNWYLYFQRSNKTTAPKRASLEWPVKQMGRTFKMRPICFARNQDNRSSNLHYCAISVDTTSWRLMLRSCLFNLGSWLFPHYAHATARQKAASPPLNFHGKTPRVMRLLCNSFSPISPPRFSTCIQSCGKSALCVS